MKATGKHRSMIGQHRYAMGLVTGILMTGLGLMSGQEAAPPTAPEQIPQEKKMDSTAYRPQPGEFTNSLTLGVGHTFVGGDEAQFMRREQRPAGTFGGLEEIHLEQLVGDNGLMVVDGRAIFDIRDYLIKLELSQPDVGYLRGGYREFRTFYDGSGGFSARSNVWLSLYDEEFHVDRGEAWVEGGLTLPDWPILTLRYSYQFREGKKDSTIWGDYNLNAGFPGGAVVRGLAPTFREIDEERQSIQADMEHTLGKTHFGLGARYEAAEQDNSLNIRRRPGEPTVTRTVTQEDAVDTHMVNARAFSETRFSEVVFFTVGGSYTRLDTDIGGSRIYGPNYGSAFNPNYANRQNNDEGFLDLDGGSRVDQYVANFNVMLTPWEHVAIVPSLRVEYQDQVGEAMFTETRVVGAGNPPTPTDVLNERIRRFTDVTEGLEFRYTGFTNWSLYARGEWVQGQGSLKEDEFDVEDEGVGPVQLQRDTDSERLVQKYTVGANWYPYRKANFGAQYYYRTRRNDYDHNLDSTAFNPPATNNLYPAFIRKHDFDTHDVNFRMTLRPLGNLTLVSRYDFQITSYNMQGGVNSFGIALNEIESAEATAHIFSQSVSWSPLARLYVQGGISYALDETETPAADLTGGAADLVQNAENDYWNATLLAGYALTPKTDLQAQYYYFRADNYVDNSLVSLPYGAGAEQHGVTATLLQQVRKNLLWKLQYGFFTGHDQTSGGNNDYHAHLIYSSMQYLF